jgi:hypothetical protein
LSFDLSFSSGVKLMPRAVDSLGGREVDGRAGEKDITPVPARASPVIAAVDASFMGNALMERISSRQKVVIIIIAKFQVAAKYVEHFKLKVFSHGLKVKRSCAAAPM